MDLKNEWVIQSFQMRVNSQNQSDDITAYVNPEYSGGTTHTGDCDITILTHLEWYRGRHRQDVAAAFKGLGSFCYVADSNIRHMENAAFFLNGSTVTEDTECITFKPDKIKESKWFIEPDRSGSTLIPKCRILSRLEGEDCKSPAPHIVCLLW